MPTWVYLSDLLVPAKVFGHIPVTRAGFRPPLCKTRGTTCYKSRCMVERVSEIVMVLLSSPPDDEIKSCREKRGRRPYQGARCTPSYPRGIDEESNSAVPAVLREDGTLFCSVLTLNKPRPRAEERCRKEMFTRERENPRMSRSVDNVVARSTYYMGRTHLPLHLPAFFSFVCTGGGTGRTPRSPGMDSKY